MTTKVETLPHAMGILRSEAEGGYCREKVTVLSGQVLRAGAVIAAIALGAATPTAAASNAANTGTIGAVTVGAGAKVGTYTVVCIEPATNAGKFAVHDPLGVFVGTATVAVAFSGGGLGFTISDGSTDFVAGESFTIAVAAGTGKVRALNTAGTDGSAVASGVLLYDADATGADVTGLALVRGPATVYKDRLVWPDGISDNNKAIAIAALAALGILAVPDRP